MKDSEKIRDLMDALLFYADPARYTAVNKKNDHQDPYTPSSESYYRDATRDRGRLARQKLGWPEPPEEKYDGEDQARYNQWLSRCYRKTRRDMGGD